MYFNMPASYVHNFSDNTSPCIVPVDTDSKGKRPAVAMHIQESLKKKKTKIGDSKWEPPPLGD
jgi:hypothetical protein